MLGSLFTSKVLTNPQLFVWANWRIERGMGRAFFTIIISSKNLLDIFETAVCLFLWACREKKELVGWALGMAKFFFKCPHGCPGWCGSVDWVPGCKLKGHRFDSQSAHLPGLGARSPVGGVWDPTDWCFSSTLMFLSLPSPLSKNK